MCLWITFIICHPRPCGEQAAGLAADSTEGVLDGLDGEVALEGLADRFEDIEGPLGAMGEENFSDPFSYAWGLTDEVARGRWRLGIFATYRGTIGRIRRSDN